MGRVFGGEHQPCGPQASVKRRQKLRSVFRWRLTFNRVCDHRLFVSHRPQGDVALFGRLNQGCRDRVNGVAELFEDRKISALRVGEVAGSSFVNSAGS